MRNESASDVLGETCRIDDSLFRSRNGDAITHNRLWNPDFIPRVQGQELN